MLTRNSDQITFAKSHCWHRSNWFEQPHFIHLRVGHQGFMLRTCIGEPSEGSWLLATKVVDGSAPLPDETLKHVSTEMTLRVLADNMKRVMSIGS